jgi:hypothetical protein
VELEPPLHVLVLAVGHHQTPALGAAPTENHSRESVSTLELA